MFSIPDCAFAPSLEFSRPVLQSGSIPNPAVLLGVREAPLDKGESNAETSMTILTHFDEALEHAGQVART